MPLLKKAVGAQEVSPTLGHFPDSDGSAREPKAIIDRRVIYRQGAPIVQVLVQWFNLHPDNNTWDYLLHILKQFPQAASLLSIS